MQAKITVIEGKTLAGLNQIEEQILEQLLCQENLFCEIT